MILEINGIDFSNCVKGLQINYETLVSENSGRNANGDAVIDVINNKVKLNVTFRPMDGDEMSKLLNAISDYVVRVLYYDSRNQGENMITCYTGTPAPTLYWVNNGHVLYKDFSLNFIQL